jgi:hypothetical protein
MRRASNKPTLSLESSLIIKQEHLGP